jgi:esterase/lipase superfamily enzyme
VIPEVRRGDETFIVTGCSMGGFHSGNFFFRRPDLFDTLIALSGLYHASYFFGDYSDELVYGNSPIDYLTWMPSDHYYWNIYRQRRIICCVGQGSWEDELLESTRRLDTVLAQKGVPHWCDYWGYDSAHDWPWWQKQIWYFLDIVLK